MHPNVTAGRQHPQESAKVGGLAVGTAMSEDMQLASLLPSYVLPLARLHSRSSRSGKLNESPCQPAGLRVWVHGSRKWEPVPVSILKQVAIVMILIVPWIKYDACQVFRGSRKGQGKGEPLKHRK